MNLAGKVIIVTGSTTGIGEATARHCIIQGAKVLIHGRDRQRGEKLVRELGPTAVFHGDDLVQPEAAKRIVRAAVDAFGKIDGLVNNAAIVTRSSLASATVELFDRQMSINLRAPLLLIQAAKEELAKTQGAVVNIGSVNAYTGEPNLLIYSITKAGLMGLSRNLADALAKDHVRVNHVNVGWVLTPNEYNLKVQEGLPEDWPTTIGLQYAPSGAMTQPEEIATHVAFWLSDASRPISGSVLELEQFPIIGRNPDKQGDE